MFEIWNLVSLAMVVYHVVINAYQIRNQSMQTCREYKFYEQIQKNILQHIYIYIYIYIYKTKIKYSWFLILTNFVLRLKIGSPESNVWNMVP